MRVMLSYYFFENAIPLGKDLATAFEALGHEVLCFDSTISPRHKRLWRLAKSLSKPFGGKKLVVKKHEQWLDTELSQRFIQAATAFQPELIIIIQGERVDAKTVQTLGKQLSARTVLWRVKPPRWQHSLFEDQPFYNEVFTIDGSVCQDGIRHLPSWALNRSVYYPGDFTAKTRELLFVGCHSPQRQTYLEAIADLPLKIVGNGWSKALPLGHPLRNKLGESWVGGAALAGLYRKAWAVVDVPQFAQHQGQGVNMRFADVPACGTVLITAASEELRHWFSGKEVLAFSGLDEFRQNCQYILVTEHSCQAMSSAAVATAKKMPDFIDRAKILIGK